MVRLSHTGYQPYVGAGRCAGDPAAVIGSSVQNRRVHEGEPVSLGTCQAFQVCLELRPEAPQLLLTLSPACHPEQRYAGTAIRHRRDRRDAGSAIRLKWSRLSSLSSVRDPSVACHKCETQDDRAGSLFYHGRKLPRHSRAWLPREESRSGTARVPGKADAQASCNSLEAGHWNSAFDSRDQSGCWGHREHRNAYSLRSTRWKGILVLVSVRAAPRRHFAGWAAEPAPAASERLFDEYRSDDMAKCLSDLPFVGEMEISGG
jgi:hypothetical protein